MKEHGLQEIHLMPFHQLGKDKYQKLGKTYQLKEILPLKLREDSRKNCRRKVIVGTIWIKGHHRRIKGKINMEGLTFEEGLIRLTQMFVFEKQEDIKNRVIGEFKDHPLAHMFGKKFDKCTRTDRVEFATSGYTKSRERSISFGVTYVSECIRKTKISGDIWMKNALAILRDTYVVDNSMLDFLVKDNPIIPEGREHIFQSALRMFLNGEFYEAMHILAPQVENLLEILQKEVGGLTVTLKDDGSSMEKVLSSILSLPELLDCYDNDILFTFRGLLNEQAGANIRNEIAHGIISEYACSTGVCLYFGVAVIKLLSLTSVSCYQRKT